MLAITLLKMRNVNYKKILDRFIEQGRLKSYTIIPTSNLAIKHPLFEYARSFDFIIITEVGLINVDVKIGIKNILSL